MEKASETSATLRPLLALLPWFGLSRFSLGKKTMIVRQVLLCLTLSFFWIWIIRNGITCLVKQADKQMQYKNMALYISYLLTGLLGSTSTCCGILYVPNKLKKVLKACDELQQDPLFEVSYNELRKKMKISLVVIFIIVIIFEAGMIAISPLINRYSLCVLSPDQTGSVLFFLNAVFSLLSGFVWMTQKSLIYLLVYVLCSLMKKQFLKCDEEFMKMLHSPPTAEKIQRIRKRYFETCELMQKVDNLLLPFIFMEINIAFINICFLLHSTIYGHLVFQILVFALSIMVTFLGAMLFLLHQGCMVYKSSKSCLETSKKLDPTKMNQASVSTLTLFIENMKSTDVGLTFLHLFLLDKAAILMVFGSLISYVIVILQLKPN